MMLLRLPFDGSYPVTDDFAAHEARESAAPGIDFALPIGTEVLAAAGGRVIRCEWGQRGGGRYLLLAHPDGSRTLYAHLQAVWRVRGERVQAGEVIALSGSTGRSTGPHLHFGLKHDGRWVDPAPFLFPGE